MQGAEEAEALEEQVKELHDLVECLEEERDGLSRSNRSLSARVRELETALVGATAMAQDLSSKHATLQMALAAANRRIDLLLCVDEAAGEGAADGGDVDLATRARQLFELYQKTLSDYEALVSLFVCGVCACSRVFSDIDLALLRTGGGIPRPSLARSGGQAVAGPSTGLAAAARPDA